MQKNISVKVHVWYVGKPRYIATGNVKIDHIVVTGFHNETLNGVIEDIRQYVRQF